MIFFKNHRNLVAYDVHSIVFGLIEGQLPWEEINPIDIVLIPNTKNPTHSTEYRPISLCNFIYKIVAKHLSTRLGQVLPSLISKSEAGCVKNRLISDIDMIDIDIMHHNNSKSTINNMALKLDMTKAFDHINWSYLHFMLLKFQFPVSTINILMKCVTTTSIAIRYNGIRTSYFKQSRYLRQGDPLSPLLFVLFMEGFSVIIN